MKLLFNISAVLLTSLTLLVTGMNTAEAKRLGGGQSFGGKFSYSQPVKKRADNGAAQRQQAAPVQQANANRKQQLLQRGGLMGMFGALAMGGLLGALFFGGAFEGINLVDILIIGLLLFVLMKWLARRAQPRLLNSAGTSEAAAEPYQQYETAEEIRGDTASASAPASLDSLRQGAPRRFDGDGFVEGAKQCFVRLQRAWDSGDLADIRQFTSDHVFGEIQEQYQARGSQNRTDILSLDAELLSANDAGSRQEAIVLFRADLKEEDRQQQVEEVWHFVKPNNSRETRWFLDGIQQVQA